MPKILAKNLQVAGYENNNKPPSLPQGQLPLGQKPN
jgi:hypothetical protein